MNVRKGNILSSNVLEQWKFDVDFFVSLLQLDFFIQIIFVCWNLNIDDFDSHITTLFVKI